MTARIITLDSDEHREVQSLLPWLANGTLARAELDRVRDHIAQCPRCQADAELQQALRNAAASIPTPGADVEQGWAAMKSRIAPKREPARGTRWPAWGWPLLAAAQGVAIVVLAVVAVTAHAPQPAEYRGLGSAAPAANAVVVFTPGATEAQVRDALRTAHARIVDGPTVTDAYLLHLDSPTPAAIGMLRAQAAVQRAESLQGGSP